MGNLNLLGILWWFEVFDIHFCLNFQGNIPILVWIVFKGEASFIEDSFPFSELSFPSPFTHKTPILSIYFTFIPIINHKQTYNFYDIYFKEQNDK